jgi:hypothetical protein
MALYTTLHLHNVPSGREAEYAAWFDDPHARSLGALRGFKGADRYEVTPQQIMPDIAQPWRFMSVYDFDLPDPSIDIPALGPLIAAARDAGLVTHDDSERLYTYRLYSDWKGSPNWRKSEPLSGVSVILANYVAGRYAEYMKWYDEVHSVEVTNVPGHVAMKRGELAVTQSPSGIAMEPRSTSGSFARTVHYFRKVSGRSFWPGGIAYAGDLSVYPGKG